MSGAGGADEGIGRGVRVQVRERGAEPAAEVRAYAERRLAPLAAALPDATRLELELWSEPEPGPRGRVAEATIWTTGPVLRSRAVGTRSEPVIDLVAEQLEAQVERYREQRRRQGAKLVPALHGAAVGPSTLPDGDSGSEGDREIVKAKRFTLEPMRPAEAVRRLELVGHDFFVFENEDDGGVSVVYRRRDGRYGLIEAESD